MPIVLVPGALSSSQYARVSQCHDPASQEMGYGPNGPHGSSAVSNLMDVPVASIESAHQPSPGMVGSPTSMSRATWPGPVPLLQSGLNQNWTVPLWVLMLARP